MRSKRNIVIAVAVTALLLLQHGPARADEPAAKETQVQPAKPEKGAAAAVAHD
jgi:hypothetical protein